MVGAPATKQWLDLITSLGSWLDLQVLQDFKFLTSRCQITPSGVRIRAVSTAKSEQASGRELINVDASVTNVCVSHSFTLVYLFLCCVHSPVASWHQVGGKHQDAVQSQDSRSLNHICTGTAGLLFLFQYWCGYRAGVPKCSTGGIRRAWFVRKCLLKGTTERKLKRFFLLGG